MLDPTGIYWSVNILVPAIIMLITFVYSLYIMIILYYNLYIRQHNWIIIPTKTIKCTAVAIPTTCSLSSIIVIIWLSINYFGYKIYGLMPSKFDFDENYPSVYMYGDVLKYIALGIYVLYLPLCYYHVCTNDISFFIVFIVSVIFR